MMVLKRKAVFLLFFIPFHLLAIVNDSSSVDSSQIATKKTRTAYYYQHQFEFSDSLTRINNSLDNFQNYIPFNHLGNSGLAFNDLFYQPNFNTGNFGFNYFKNNYSNYFFTPQNIKFYNTRTPYTDLFYTAGSNNEQLVRVIFSYNIKKNWNATVNFNRIRSKGFYNRQVTNDNFFNVSTNYKSSNNRYYLLGAFIYNSAKNEENGGNLTSIDSIRGVKDSIGAINLHSASRTINQKSVFVKQYLNIGKKSDDTTNATIIPSSRFILTSLLENNVLKYQSASPDSQFYTNSYYDVFTTYDSVVSNKIENELLWKRLDNSKHRGFKDMIGASFSVKHQFINIKSFDSINNGTVNLIQKNYDIAFNNIIIGSDFYNTYTTNKCWWDIGGKYTLTGYNKNNYVVNASLKKALKDSLNYLVLNAQAKSQAPDFIYNYYHSNHFFWSNGFSPTTSQSVSAIILFKKARFSFGADYSVYQNTLYFNESAMAAQYKGSIPVFHAFVKKDFTFYNWHLNNKINFQAVPDSSVIRVPKFILEHALFYAHPMFNKVVNLQIGFTVYYVSSYYANAYMPTAAEFYLQNSTKCGNYPAINFFLNAQIKTVRIFFKIDNLDDGWIPNNKFVSSTYSLTPNYQMNGLAIKFGVSWQFFD